MIRVRRVEDIAIIDWSHKDVATVVPRIRALVDSHEASRVLLNMREVETLKGEGLETLTEALSVCEDGGCTLAMYGLNTYLTKLLDIMGLHEVMPQNLGDEEVQAVTAVKAMQADGAVLEAELDFDNQKDESTEEEADVEFEFDAPEARPSAKRSSSSAMPPTIKFDKAAVAAAPSAPEGGDDDLLAIHWADVTTQGIRIGGPGGREIAARLDAEDHTKTQALPAAGLAANLDRAAAARPTAKLPPAAASGELEIEIEDVPAKPASKPRDYKTEVIPTFDLRAAERAAAEKAKSSTDDAEGLEVDFEPVSADKIGLGQPSTGFMQGGEAPALFGGQESEEGSSEWSPVDDPRRAAGPPAAARIPAPAAQPPSPARPNAQPAPGPTPRPAGPARPAPAQPAPVAQPATPAQPARMTPPAVAPAARTQQPAAPQQPVAPPQPVATPQQPMDAGDETVMFQADGLLAEVLAAVTAEAAAPAAEAPSTEPQPDTAVLTAAQAAGVAPAPLSAAPGAAATKPEPVAAPKDGAEELRVFLSDYALVTELHLRVLDKFSREGVEKVLGRPEVQSAVGGSAAAISSILEDFVQARLLRRRRSPRIRGGTGFLYTPSPKTRNAVTRLLRRYEDGATRAEVMNWVQAARKANEK